MRTRGFVTGLIAAIAGMSAAHLVAALLDPSTSPVVAVGSTVIDATPTPLKEFAVREFGTADKPILLGSVLITVLVAAGLIGIVATRRRSRGVGLLAVLVLPAAVSVLLRPQARLLDLVPTLVAAAVGPACLWFLTRPATASPATGTAQRRGFLIGAGAVLAFSAVAGGTGEYLKRARSRISEIMLPRATRPLPELPEGLPEVSPFRTPTKDFYRVDTKLTVPLVDHMDWRLRIDGMVDREVTLSYQDLLAMPLVEHDITLTCVSNEVGGPYVGAARWLGVPLSALLDRAGVKEGPDQILSTDVDGFTISTPLAVATDGRNAMVAVGMNGEVLPRRNGFPARLVVPGLYGFVGATKWLTRMTLTTYDAQMAYWTERDWATDAPIRISSRIDVPRPFTEISPGDQLVGGVAWAPGNGIERVEVQADGGAWQEARLGPDAGIDYWRQWHFTWPATKGSHTLAVRAIGRDGTVQTDTRRTPFPSGSSGIQRLAVRVS